MALLHGGPARAWFWIPEGEDTDTSLDLLLPNALNTVCASLWEQPSQPLPHCRVPPLEPVSQALQVFFFFLSDPCLAAERDGF